MAKLDQWERSAFAQVVWPCFAWVFFAGPLYAQPVLLSTDQWREDIDQAVEVIIVTHPMPAHDLAATGLRNAARRLKSDMAGLEDKQILLRLAQLVALIEDGHTRLEIPRLHVDIGVNDAHGTTPSVEIADLSLDRLPIEIEAYDDGYFITRTTADWSELLGSRVVSVNGRRVDELAEKLTTLAHGENPGWKKRIVADRLTLIDALRFCGLSTHPTVDVTIETNGTEHVVALKSLGEKAASWDRFDTPDSLTRWSQPNRDYWFKGVNGHPRIGYLHYRRSGYDAEHPPTTFARSLLETAKRDDWSRLIIDLRDNGGGNAMWNQPLLEAVIGHPIFDRPGGLYVLIGPDTFSAAALFANELEQHTHAIFVGAPTGNALDHYGDPMQVRLANSGLTVRVSTIHWKNWLAGEYRVALIPQIPVPRRFDDLKKGADPALEVALTHAVDGDPVIQFAHLLENVDVNAAAIYLARIAMDPRLGADIERNLIELGKRYRADGRLTQSRYTLLLAETYYSHSSEVLFEYGQTLESLQRWEDAIGAYERAQERNPESEEVRGALQRVLAVKPGPGAP